MQELFAVTYLSLVVFTLTDLTQNLAPVFLTTHSKV